MKDKKIFEQCVQKLYPKNKSHQKLLLRIKTPYNLLVEDIILYQRPLKSKNQKYLIASMKYAIETP